MDTKTISPLEDYLKAQKDDWSAGTMLVQETSNGSAWLYWIEGDDGWHVAHSYKPTETFNNDLNAALAKLKEWTWEL